MSTMASQTEADVFNTPETRVMISDDGRGGVGYWTVAARNFAKGDVIFQEPPLAMVYPSYDPPWLAVMRKALLELSEACAWQYCVAVHCLTAAELTYPVPEGLKPFSEVARARLMQLCGGEFTEGEEPSELADAAAEHFLKAAESIAGTEPVRWPAAAGTENIIDRHQHRKAAVRWLAQRLDDIALRVSRNGFQVMDLKMRPPTSADGLFHRISFFNHCCAGLSNASWTWNGGEGLNTIRTTAEVVAGEELTISYIAKPWCDLAKPARRRYLKQNFNFVCMCKACTQPPSAAGTSRDTSNVKSDGKLGSLLLRWMQDGGDTDGVIEGGAAAEAPCAPNEPKAPLTDDARLERVLQRCAGESLEVSREAAQAALTAEDGHVGKTMIRLRRQKKHSEEPTEAEGQQEKIADAVPARKQPLTDDDRLRRVLERCSGEGLDVTSDEAKAALQAEEGHVGKAMIRLRRANREGAAGKSSKADTAIVGLRSLGIAAFICISAVAVVAFLKKRRV
eukprot:gnl/TRDRNA2_/TRDRNA2_192218_c0_seq1.p1 gnl/TRDRNA2_/TRDRNA2_192218_c0~~gnl/TRDRNA2_/TRDRNA2_192218_c0_seq1.p1  ORF type:complete len:508 (-),score=97.44 gnl/TRDRNA2_/TRDRNA2_192218_c0_seq1:12-1535(-)